MVRVDFPRRGRVNQIDSELRNLFDQALHQRLGVAQTAVRQVPEFRRTIAQHLGSCDRLALPDSRVTVQRAVSQHHHANRNALPDMARNRGATAKHLIVRMRRQHQNGPGRYLVACDVGDEIRFQWTGGNSKLTAPAARDTGVNDND